MKSVETVVTVRVQCDVCTCEEPCSQVAEAPTKLIALHRIEGDGWLLTDDLDACPHCWRGIFERRQAARDARLRSLGTHP